MDQQDQGIMTYFEAEAHSFVLRIWQENREDPNGRVEWRGWIEHVQSGQRHYFRDLKDLPQLVGAYIGDTSDLEDHMFMPIQPKSTQK